MKKINVALDFQDDETKCPKCQNTNYRKAGKQKNGKQTYICKNCNRRFTNLVKKIHSRYVLPKNISSQEMKILDVWDLRILGKKPGSVGDYSINFLGIYPDWLKQAVKDFIWFRTVSLSTATIINNVRHLKVISYFAEVNKIYLHPQDIFINLHMNITLQMPLM